MVRSAPKPAAHHQSRQHVHRRESEAGPGVGIPKPRQWKPDLAPCKDRSAMLGGRGGREHSSTSVAHGATAGRVGRRRRCNGFVADLPVGRRGCGTHSRQPDSAGVVHLCDRLCGTGRSICTWEWPKSLDDDGDCACRLDRRRSDLGVLRNYFGAQSLSFSGGRLLRRVHSAGMAGDGPVADRAVTGVAAAHGARWRHGDAVPVSAHVDGRASRYVRQLRPRGSRAYPLCSCSFRSATSWC